jgi:hypothetical protein
MISYDDLQRSLAAGNVCAFVGAGLSAGAGLPGWYDLIAGLAGRIGYKLPPREWATGDALIDAAQAYVNHQGLHSGAVSRPVLSVAEGSACASAR